MYIIPGSADSSPLVSGATMRPIGEALGLIGNQSPPQNQLPGLPTDGLRFRGWLPTGSTASGSGTAPGLSGDGSAAAFGPSSGSADGQGGFLGLLNRLINQLGSYISQTAGEANAEGAGTQTVSDGTFASTGDPHLSETGTQLDASGNASSVNGHFDSMSSHDNLLSSQDFDGGYRLSTAVTAPNAKGVTLNASATVHMNSDDDNITLRNDGTFTISSGGNSVPLGAGQSVTLGGGEQVTRNTDGSLTVDAANAYGGAISTTLAARGGGVDVTAVVHAATIGGDIAAGQTANGAPGVGTYVQTAVPTTFA